MAKDGGGSNSDVEEITSDDFKIRDSSGSRVWMNDLMRYSTSRNFNQDLYSFAWAQAVQNKPLGFDVAKKEDDDDEIEMFVVDDDENENEKEEGEGDGELEEGEIGFGSETANNAEEKKVEEEVTESEEKVEEEIGEFDKRVGTILEELDSVTEEEAESSFEEVCSRLQKAFASLKQMFSEGHNPVLDVLALQAFMGIQTVYSAFSSGNLKEMDQNKELLLRLLIHIKNQYSVLLTTEQVKEIDIRVHTLASEDVTVGKTGDVPEVPSVKLGLVPSGNNSVVSNNKLDIPSFRNRVDFSPLLNLHADYDEDSLPSPTRDSAPPLPVLKPIGIGVRATVPNQKTVESANGTFHPYVTDAFNAVSSYQQKYGNNSNFVCNDLPSPTPSEDGNGGGGDNDTHGEVSSSSVISKVRNVEPNNTVAIPQSAPIKTVGLTPVLKSSAKSRDPRLRFMNTQDGPLANSRKHKTTEEPANDDHPLKRQRNGLMSSRNVQVQPNENMVVGSRNIATGEVGIDRRLNCNSNFNGLNGGSVHTNPNGLNGGSVPNTSTSTLPSVLLPSLLKGIAVNPTMLMQLVQMEQQRMAAEGQQKVVGPIGNRLPVAPSNASVMPLEVGKQPAAKPHLMPPQSASMNTQKDTGVIRMKPRDPRRILLTNMVQKSEGSGPEPGKTSAPLQSDMQRSNDPLTVREQGEQAQHAIVSSQSTTPKPDIKNPKDHADSTSQPIPGKVSNNSTESKTQGAPTANPWGDVDHLLDGYDEQQKAAVQKERARRIEEQSKMFSSKKLCLVLDLDHTLLNSAKFIEVDPAHEEILRKKEEQDRAKPQRHLFRFHHMGMWTKLRPGIWNFLEKASKLYELHLYTMGNKLYATEMAKVLDPTGALFAGRVISKGDEGDSDGDERVPKNKDLDGVLGMESAVVIIDDSVRIWPHNKLNLIVVERYTYFPCSRRQFGLAGPSLLEIDHDERPEAGTLASSLGVIERIHQNFFSHQVLKEVDVRNILASEQRKILAGCKIVFSRIFPVGEANPHLHPLWQAAEQFGAECTNQIDEHVTHVVANSLGTDKVNWALSTGRFVVHPSWVEASTLLYRRANEQDFAVKI